MNQGLQNRTTYWLARRWLEGTRLQPKWGVVPKILDFFFRGRVKRRASNVDLIGDELFLRFEVACETALDAAECPEILHDRETTRCHMQLQNIVNADPKAHCFPELLWTEIDKTWPIADSKTRMRERTRFHLCALIYEMPSSDERKALRDHIFSADPKMRYSASQQRQVAHGLYTFAEYLNGNRDRVERLTCEAIRSSALLSVEDALDLIMSSIGVEAKRTMP